jgi:hypothetical protein
VDKVYVYVCVFLPSRLAIVCPRMDHLQRLLEEICMQGK